MAARRKSRVSFKVRSFWSDVRVALMIGLLIGFLLGVYYGH